METDSRPNSPVVVGSSEEPGSPVEAAAAAAVAAQQHRLYPSDDQVRLHHALMALKASHFGVYQLVPCLEACWDILRQCTPG
jgi:hypothetical protein